MIKNIDYISNFAIFKNFVWDEHVRDKGNNKVYFEKLNIIYGRNYSGKTTLSRVINSFEEKKVHEKYLDSVFQISLDDGRTFDNTTVSDHDCHIRVYNSDFVNKNLRCLIDEEGEILPFAIVGETNQKIELEIEELQKELGKEEPLEGLYKEKFDLNESLKKEQKNIEHVIRNLDNKLKLKAKEIKENTEIFDKVTYQIRNINSDIDYLAQSEFTKLSEDQIEKNKQLLKESIKPTLYPIQIIDHSIENITASSKVLLEKKIVPTEPIQELLNDTLLQQWVKKGIEHHKNVRTHCAFCGQTLPNELWIRLDSHFNKESENLTLDINVLIEKINSYKVEIPNEDNRDSYYIANREQYLDLMDKRKNLYSKYNTSLDNLISQLKNRRNDIFNIKPYVLIQDYSKDIIKIEDEINILINSNNLKTASLKEDKDNARRILRLDTVQKFIESIDYQNEKNNIKIQVEEVEKRKEDFTRLESRIYKIASDIEVLKTKTKDEKKGAEQVNKYLNNYFGHNSLKLAHEEGADKYRFVIKRGDNLAYNLSEGESSLISFCYFMAKLEDIETKDKKLIIWIDDPISSLDSNHVFFIYSLIESVIAKNKLYEQLFISTHNLDFLKYIKRLTIPKKKVEQDGKMKRVPSIAHFFVERNNEESKVIVMPSYLQKYVTEFNYLFEQIYKCSKISSVNDEYECVYSFGNNMRKFLEAYLFYKYPNNSDILVKMGKFFKEDTAINLIQRVDNELSHLEEIFDRSMKPILIPEIPTLASYVINKIKENDFEQYKALMSSIGMQSDI